MNTMIQKSIAAFVLATLCWLSVPVAIGSMTAGTMHSAHHKAPPAQDHSCCPRPGARMVPVLFIAVNLTEMPCGAQHPCCVKQRPASPSNVPVQNKFTRPAAEQTLATFAEKTSSDRGRVIEISTVGILPPPFERSTVLRI
jgi:hypothetical protein